VVDPFEAVAAVLDRGSICALLDGLQGLCLGCGAAAGPAAGGAQQGQGRGRGGAGACSSCGSTARARGPRHLEVASFEEPGLLARIAAAGAHPAWPCALPGLVPSLACPGLLALRLRVMERRSNARWARPQRVQRPW
jgi:hypothetical protein